MGSRTMIDEMPEVPGAEAARRVPTTEETAYAGSLATSDSVERVIEARSGGEPEPLALKGVIAELHRQAEDRLRRAKTQLAL